MRLIVFLVATAWLAIICAEDTNVYPESKASAAQLFDAWKTEHGKVYRSVEEEHYRFATFMDNLKYINTLNAQYRGKTEFAVNHFADMSPTEFRNTLLMPPRPAPIHTPDRYLHVEQPRDPLPEAFDWTNQTKKVVTAVKNQGSVGSCWAMSTIENVEGQWAMLDKPLTELSVEQLVDCDGTQDQKNMRADCGVFGGWPYLAYQYIMRTGGLMSEADYKYCSGLDPPDTCFPCKAPGFNKTLCGPPVPWCLKNESCSAKLDPNKFVHGLKIQDWKRVLENETVIASALMTTGPLSVALDATMLQFYRRGVFDPFDCSKTALNHAVLLVGWGVEKGLLEKKDFWKVKNSWGPKWGYDGYFLMRRGKGLCGIDTQVTTAVLQKA